MKLHKSILDLLDSTYWLVDVNYDTTLDDFKVIEKAIDNQDMSPIWEHIDDWFWEDYCDSLIYALDELEQNIMETFDVSQERAEEFIEKYRDWIVDEIYARDRCNPVRDVLKNTGDIIVYYDVEDDIMDTVYMKEDEWKESIKTIKKSFGIKLRDKTWDRDLDELLANASYGGRLVVYFSWDVENLCKLQGMNEVEFKNPHIALIDTMNGSGHDVQLKGLTCKLPFNILQLYVEKTQHYNYTYEVCGMSDSWCDDTDFHFSKNKRRNVK